MLEANSIAVEANTPMVSRVDEVSTTDKPPKDFREAMDSRKCWSQYMLTGSENLKKLLDANIKDDDYHCSMCDKPMINIDIHLCSKRHYNAVWATLPAPMPSVEEASGLHGKPWVQTFTGVCTNVHFNHLTGEASVEQHAPSRDDAFGVYTEMDSEQE